MILFQNTLLYIPHHFLFIYFLNRRKKKEEKKKEKKREREREKKKMLLCLKTSFMSNYYWDRMCKTRSDITVVSLFLGVTSEPPVHVTRTGAARGQISKGPRYATR